MTSRKDSSVQRSAKRAGAERRRCPECKRGAALRYASDAWDDGDGNRAIVSITDCRWRDVGKCTYREVVERPMGDQHP